jgi:hypothetical protein
MSFTLDHFSLFTAQDVPEAATFEVLGLQRLGGIQVYAANSLLVLGDA